MALLAPGQKPFNTQPISFGTPSPSPSPAFSTPTQTSTPASTPTQFTPFAQQGGIFGSLAAGHGGAPYGAAAEPPIQTTSSGGVNFAAAHPNNTPANPQAAIGSDASRSYPTPNGGVTQLGAGGGIASNTPATGYSINTSGSIPSSALSSNLTPADLSQTHSQYQDYVAALSKAQQYSPEYLQAYQQQQEAQLNQARLQSNLYTGNNLPGDTMNYAQGATAKAQAQNTLQSAEAGIQLQTQALLRQGNIAGAQSLVQAAQPTSVSPGSSLVSPLSGQEAYSGLGGYQAVQGIQNVNSLMAQFPDAGINQQDSPQVATQKASQSPSFQSRNLQQITLPGGGVSFINKNQLTTDPRTGQTTIISPAQGAQADALKQSIGGLQQGLSTAQQAITTADSNFPLLLQTMKASGINNFGAPLANQVQQKVQQGFSGVLAPYNALVQSLQATYSQILSRGGNVTNETRDEANKLVNGTLSYNDMQKLYQTLKAESKNVLNGYSSEIQNNSQKLNEIYGQGQPAGGTQGGAVGSSWDNL